MKTFVLTLALCVLTVGLCVAAEKPTQLYQEALRLQREGKPAEATEMLWRIVNEHGEDSLVPYALLQIGKISETDLGDYDTAVSIYQRIVAESSAAGALRRAKARLRTLEHERRSGDVPLRAYHQVLRDYQRLGSDEALRRMKDLVAKHADFGELDKALLWIGDEHLRRDDFAAATEWFGILRDKFPQSRSALLATFRIATAWLEAGELDAAEAEFRRLAEFTAIEPRAPQLVEAHLAMVHRFRQWRALYQLSLLIAVGMLVVWLVGTRWPAVTAKHVMGGLVDAAPVALVAAAGSVWLASINAPQWKEVAWAGAALAVGAGLNHLFVATRGLSRRGKAIWLALMFITALSFVYAVYYQTDMINQMYHSIEYEARYMMSNSG
ncbi:MAG: tetratricopeptide repeat protein [Candidatus Lernaella stagnicola]|nr:tetratricopeptide repeat protein [Candidatus Lernaella stagnicola]